jgi:hypothetical protein
MRVDGSAGKCASGVDKLGSVVDRMDMKLKSMFLSSLKVKTQFLKWIQCVIVVYGHLPPNSHQRVINTIFSLSDYMAIYIII